MSPTSEIPEKEHQEKISTNPSSGKRKVTLYFPCYNAEKYIGDCLEGALKQTYPIEEILVIDDGSTDGSMEIVSQYPVKIIQHEVNKGLAAARNTAIQNATGDFIASLDSDCVPEPDWLERLMENFTLSPTVLGGMGVEQIAGVGGKLLEAHTTTVADLWRSVHLKQHWGDGKIVDLADPLFVFGSNNVYRKDALLKVGLYNEEYRTNFEDCDMFARLKAANYTMIYEPKAIARHLRRDDVCSVIKTLWNWTKPTHKRDGHFDSFKGLTQKINTNLGLATKYLVEDISRRKIQILYPDLLMMPYHTLLDLKFRHQLQTLSDEPNRHELEMLEQTFNALILLAAWTIKQKSPDTDLAKLVAENLLTIQLDNPQTPPLSLEELEKLSLQTSDTLDINRYPSVNESYLDYFFTGFRHVLNKIADDSLVFKMVEVSGKAVHQKAEGGKRKENTTHPTVDTVELSPITNHQSPVKVLLANPPWRKGNRYGVRAGSRWPFTMEIGNAPIPGYVPFPFFLAYATANLKKHGIEAIIVDAIAEGLTDEEFIYRVRGYKPDLILIETATASIDVDLNMAERLKAECDNDVYIALSGTHATVMKESLLKEHEYIDFILYGEYEFTLLELAQCLQNGKIPPAPFNKGGENLEEVQGLAFRRDSEISVTPPRLLIENLDELPWPERLSLPMYNYNDQFAGMPYPNVQIMASRGCPFQCIFCVWPQILYGGAKYRTRSPKDVVDEIEWLIDYYGFEAFYFDDDTFNIGKKRILEICDEIKKRGVNVPWAVMARADTSDRETLQAMSDAGLYAIKFGVESGVQELVDNCGKKLDLSKVRTAVDICKELGVQTHLTFTFGLPGETRDTIQKTIDFAIELDPDSVQFSLTTPFPGTRYFDMLDEKGLLCSKNWADYDGALSAVIQTENLTREELEAALEEANLRWNEHRRRRLQTPIGSRNKLEQELISLENAGFTVQTSSDYCSAPLIIATRTKKQIAFVTNSHNVRLYKQASALKNTGQFEILLIAAIPGDGFPVDCFDKIVIFRNQEELEHILQNIHPYLTHVHMQEYCPEVAAYVIQASNSTTIVDPYDLNLLWFEDIIEDKLQSEPEDAIQDLINKINLEKMALLSADGIVNKHRWMDNLYERLNVQVPTLHLLDCCSEKLFVANPNNKVERWPNIVYAGNMMSQPTADRGGRPANRWEGNLVWAELFDKICRDHIYLDVYPAPYLSQEEKNWYQQMFSNHNFIQVHDGIPYSRDFTKEISKYHFGWSVFLKYRAKRSDFSFRVGIGSKVFSYLESGIPVLTSSDSEYLADMVKKYEIGYVIGEDDLDHLKDVLAAKNYSQLAQNVLEARDEFKIESKVSDLIEFYQECVATSTGNEK